MMPHYARVAIGILCALFACVFAAMDTVHKEPDPLYTPYAVIVLAFYCLAVNL